MFTVYPASRAVTFTDNSLIAFTRIGIRCDPWYFKESSSLLLITTGSEPSKARISCAKNPYF